MDIEKEILSSKEITETTLYDDVGIEQAKSLNRVLRIYGEDVYDKYYEILELLEDIKQDIVPEIEYTVDQYFRIPFNDIADIHDDLKSLKHDIFTTHEYMIKILKDLKDLNFTLLNRSNEEIERVNGE